jgi:uncharacterized protein (DUF58 family)
MKAKIIWGFFLITAAAGAWFLGERLLYVSAVVLFVLPFLSYTLTSLLLKGLKVTYEQPKSITKNEEGILSVSLHNRTFLPLVNLDIIITADEHAVIITRNQTLHIYPLGKHILKIPFLIEFRGHYELGLQAVHITDITGLFKFKRACKVKTITALPMIAEHRNLPLTHMMSQGSSRYDIRDEDYSTISDIRQYLPTDSIKRVHWKLTAKRNEWLVKNFQSNALNHTSVLLDSTRLELSPRGMYALEDCMTETALGLANSLLIRGMSVDFLSNGQKTSARNLAEFEPIYKTASELRFSHEALNCVSVLNNAFHEASGYINVILVTALLDSLLYERIIYGVNNGHNIAVFWITPREYKKETEDIFKLLSESGISCTLMRAFDDEN